MEGPDELAWVNRLQTDDANFVAAIDWYLEHDPSAVLAFARPLGQSWYLSGDLVGTADRLSRMLEAARSVGPTDPVEDGWALVRLGWPQFLTGDFGAAMTTLDEAARELQEAGEQVGLSLALAAYAHDELDGMELACEEGIAHQRAAENSMYLQLLRIALGIALQAAAVLAATIGGPMRSARLWGAAGTLGPVWPLFTRRYGELLALGRAELGDMWETEEAAGTALTPEEAVALATP